MNSINMYFHNSFPVAKRTRLKRNKMNNKFPTNFIIVRQPDDQFYGPNKTVMSNNNQQNRKRKVKLKKWSLVEEYCENSTIHGFRYFSKQNIHWFERLWWIVMVLCSLVACCIFIVESYHKWDENPVIVTFSEKMTHLKEIPFPAVTICPETKTQRNFFNYSATLRKIDLAAPPLYNLTEREYALASAQFQICETYIVKNENNIGENFTSDVIFDLIREVAPTLPMSLISCAFRTATGLCSEIFEEIVTDDGLCFTFNSLTSKEMLVDTVNDKFMSANNNITNWHLWTLEDGYTEGYDDNSTSDVFLYPYRVLSAGSKAGLKVTMATNMVDLDYACRGPVQGFKVILHTPNELPQVDGQYFRIPVGQDIRVSIKPNMLRTTKSLTSYKPHRRQCFFNFERKLRYMRTYTKRNCELECLTNITLASCGCVKFSMPHDDNTPLCGIAKVNCYTLAENYVLEDTDTIELSRKINSCNCLPACTSLSYDAEISQATYEWKSYFKALNFTTDFITERSIQFASISIFFKENQFITSKRSELVGLNDFVSSCGGVLGLFMGVSLLSIIELVYYFSLRLFCSIRTNNIDSKAQRMALPKLKRRVRSGSGKQIRQIVKPWYIGRT